MMISTMSLTNEELEDYVNLGREAFLKWLHNEKYINEKTYIELCKTTRIMLKEPSKLSRFYSKFFKGEKKEPLYFVPARFHQLPLEESTEEKEEK